jgi:ABC-type iron transport system FetAB permease component
MYEQNLINNNNCLNKKDSRKKSKYKPNNPIYIGKNVLNNAEEIIKRFLNKIERRILNQLGN